MSDIPQDEMSIAALVGILAFLIVLSAFFSAAEIGLMTLNRYRVRHLAESGQRSARIALKLLARPDRLLGVILLGNNFANIAASAVATVIGLELYGEAGIAIATGLLTLVVLIFGEVAPKTLAALHPERTAFPVVYVLQPMLKLLYPFVWMVNAIANRFLRVFGVSLDKRSEQLSREELKAILTEAGTLIPENHQRMLLAILELEKMTVDDVMVPRGEIEGVDLESDWDEIISQIGNSRFTRLPVYRGSLDDVLGMLHLRKVLNLMHRGKLDRAALEALIAQPYFIPEGTPLNTQLLQFKSTKRRSGLVVDEYGDILGLVTLEEILEEIVGDFTTQPHDAGTDLQPEKDGSYLVQGSMNVRELNRRIGWELPIDGPKTVNGLITEYLESLPEPGTTFLLEDYQIEIVRTRGTRVQLARLRAFERGGST